MILAVDMLEAMIKSAKAVYGKSKATITFDIPTDGANVYEGTVTGSIGLTMDGQDVKVTGVVMPCRL
jgi:hypothetical protein